MELVHCIWLHLPFLQWKISWTKVYSAIQWWKGKRKKWPEGSGTEFTNSPAINCIVYILFFLFFFFFFLFRVCHYKRSKMEKGKKVPFIVTGWVDQVDSPDQTCIISSTFSSLLALPLLAKCRNVRGLCKHPAFSSNFLLSLALPALDAIENVTMEWTYTQNKRWDIFKFICLCRHIFRL